MTPIIKDIISSNVSVLFKLPDMPMYKTLKPKAFIMASSKRFEMPPFKNKPTILPAKIATVLTIVPNMITPFLQ